jgi:hypothetical protein
MMRISILLTAFTTTTILTPFIAAASATMVHTEAAAHNKSLGAFDKQAKKDILQCII